MKYLNDVSYKDCIGKVCKSLNSGDFKILKYNDSYNVDIQFLKTGYEMVAQLGHIKNGVVKDPYLPSVYGVGILGTKYQAKINGVITKEYDLWHSMLQRCYSDAYQKKQPTYEGCEVSDNFKSYEYFYEWCHRQVGFDNKDWHLDKDLLFKGNKLYSEYTCVFLPREINILFTTRVRFRGDSPIGVHFSNGEGKYVAQISDGKSKGNRTHLGLFNDEYSAFCAYKEAKEIKIKEIAEKWKGKIDDRAYDALINYQVDITD